MAIFGGYGVCKGQKQALQDYWLLTPGETKLEKTSKESPYGMELQGRKAYLTAGNKTIFCVDANCSINEIIDHSPYFQNINDFEETGLAQLNEDD